MYTAPEREDPEIATDPVSRLLHNSDDDHLSVDPADIGHLITSCRRSTKSSEVSEARSPEYSHQGVGDSIYQPLSPGHIRIVEFASSAAQHDIKCSLIECPLDTESCLPLHYDALSYTWGDHERTETIEINGQSMSVTWNLFYALFNLQANHRRLWIDALCINQDDLEEREAQVREMSMIYKQAQSVVVWLGESTLETAALMKPLSSMQPTLELYKTDGEPPDSLWDNIRTVFDTAADPGLSNAEHVFRQELGLKILMARPWFTRIWIIQEVANARSIHVYCGKNRIPGKIFAMLPSLVDVTIGKHRQAILDVMRGDSGDSSWWNESRGLLTLLRRFRRSQASEPRDRIYALLGICSDYLSTLAPSYRITDQEVIRQTLIYLFGQAAYNISASGAGYSTISSFLEDIEDLYRKALDFFGIEVDNPETFQAALNTLEYHYGWREFEEVVGTLRFILGHPAAKGLRLTPRMIETCGNHTKDGVALMRLLIDCCDASDVCIRDDEFRWILWPRRNHRDIIRLMIDRTRTRLELTMHMILEVLYELDGDEDTVELLLRSCTNQNPTMTIVGEVASADPPATGDKVLRLLLRKTDPDLVFTEASVNTILQRSSNDNIQLFLKKHGEKLELTPKVLNTAIHSWNVTAVRYLLKRYRKNGIAITKGEVMEAKAIVELSYPCERRRKRRGNAKERSAVILSLVRRYRYKTMFRL